ncbi:MAG: DNA topoisomerase VI subunit B [Promethearchaeota archaeon]|nr:MAG: DNA topoisomerase VI subunit B [Candidatus Lokiarchaeota archaeon]
MPQITAQKEKSTIKQGTIAEFMRKRTQLVGFEFGYWKHSQYAAEFLDNALDAIESFQWKEVKKPDSKIKFTLDQELSLENLSILKTEKEEEKKSSEPINDEAKHMLKQEIGIEPVENDTAEVEILEPIEIKPEEIIDEIEVEEEVQNIIKDMEEIIKPVETIIDNEPIVIIRLSEAEAASFLTSELSQKNIMNYTFEIFDNGTGMNKLDLRKFGRYLASSKSTELKQTRGSQGFGAPSAFSDSQNTTGRPIIAVSKSKNNVYATVSEFFTTSKNEKKYLVHPTDVDCPFLHGTYIKLHYLNVKYIRGYVDIYVKETALMNPHITIIFIDPYNEEHIYPRKVSTFPVEPHYAKPHPSSTNIGDLQDLLIKTENHTISSFLKDNFVRVSSKTAKQIIDLAERDLQDKLNFLILKSGFIKKLEKKTDPIHYTRFEKRIYGRSQKPRDKLIIYEVISDDLKTKYWDLISNYNELNKKHEKISKNIQKQYNLIEKAETQKEIKSFEKNIRAFLKDIDGLRKQKDNIRTELDKMINSSKDGLHELKKFKDRSDIEELVKEIQLSKTKPAELTNDQFNSLFLAFKSVKYMAPPTDTAIPVGESVLENTLIKEIGLKVSDNLDDFDTPVEDINKSTDILLEVKKNELKKGDPTIKDDILNNISISDEEVHDISSQILANVDIKDESLETEQFKQSLENIIASSEDKSQNVYGEVFDYFIETFTRDDDFVAAETRDPTSGKGLAYVVEAVMAHSKLIETPKRSRDVLSRFVNRTPKLRDSADCAITKAVQAVNWKNYKLETYDNNLPKGPIKLLVNVSGPFVHLMFKSQSKNSLADDEDLIKEIKYCLEAIGRRLRMYLNRRASIRKTEKRASLIDKYIPLFVKSLYNIVSEGEGSKYKEKVKEKELQNLMREAIGKKSAPVGEAKAEREEIKIEPVKPLIKEKEIEAKPKIEIPKEDEVKKKELEKKEVEVKKIEPRKEEAKVQDFNILTVRQLYKYANENNIKLPSKARKNDIIKKIKESISKKEIIEPKIEKVPPKQKKIAPPLPKKEAKVKTKPVVKPKVVVKPKPAVKSKPATKPKPAAKPKPIVKPPQPKQTQLPMITNSNIFNALTNEWQTIKHLIFKLKIKDMMDARFLQIKLKELERKGEVLVDIKMGKKHWKKT